MQDAELRGFVETVLSHVPGEFFEMPASTSGKYHPMQSLGEGGLVRHVLGACYFGKELCRAYSCPQDQDIVVAAIILHDIAKAIGEPHDLVGELFIRSIMEKYAIVATDKLESVLDGVRWHMGPWAHGACQSRSEKSLDKVFPENFSRLAQIVHLADYTSSRRETFLAFLPGAPDVQFVMPADGTCRCFVCKTEVRVDEGSVIPKCCGRFMEVRG